MNSSISFFASVRLMNGRSTVTFGSSSTSAIDASDLLVEDHASRRREDQLAVTPVLDRVLEVDLLRRRGELDLLLRGEPLRPRLELRDVERRHVAWPAST